MSVRKPREVYARFKKGKKEAKKKVWLVELLESQQMEGRSATRGEMKPKASGEFRRCRRVEEGEVGFGEGG